MLTLFVVIRAGSFSRHAVDMPSLCEYYARYAFNVLAYNQLKILSSPFGLARSAQGRLPPLLRHPDCPTLFRGFRFYSHNRFRFGFRIELYFRFRFRFQFDFRLRFWFRFCFRLYFRFRLPPGLCNDLPGIDLDHDGLNFWARTGRCFRFGPFRLKFQSLEKSTRLHRRMQGDGGA